MSKGCLLSIFSSTDAVVAESLWLATSWISAHAASQLSGSDGNPRQNDEAEKQPRVWPDRPGSTAGCAASNVLLHRFLRTQTRCLEEKHENERKILSFFPRIPRLLLHEEEIHQRRYPHGILKLKFNTERKKTKSLWKWNKQTLTLSIHVYPMSTDFEVEYFRSCCTYELMSFYGNVHLAFIMQARCRLR